MDDAARQAAITCDPDAPISARLDALVAVVDAVHFDNLQLPDELEAAVDDLALIDMAIAIQRASVILALLHMLGPRPQLATSRRRIVRRMLAAGVTGIALGGLAFAIGDHEAGAQLAARDFAEHIAPLVAAAPSQILVDAWLGWLADQPDASITATLRALHAQGLALATALPHATNPEVVARINAISEGMLAP